MPVNLKAQPLESLYGMKLLRPSCELHADRAAAIKIIDGVEYIPAKWSDCPDIIEPAVWLITIEEVTITDRVRIRLSGDHYERATHLLEDTILYSVFELEAAKAEAEKLAREWKEGEGLSAPIKPIKIDPKIIEVIKGRLG